MSYREKNPEKSLWGASTPADMKLARQRHKNQNFEKNGTYVKDNGVLRMPTNFFDDPTIFGDRSPKNQKWPFSACVGRTSKFPRHFALFLALIVSQVHQNAGMLKIKGQFKVS